jgi:uncharacterized protein (DUF983 family)
LLARGFARRCGRCGAGQLFRSWFRLVDRCPRCGYRFDREEGFFLGAFVINFAVTTAGLFALVGVMIAMLANGGDNASITPIAIIAVAETIVVPIAFYPFSKTVWAAIDLALHQGDGSAGSAGGHTT